MRSAWLIGSARLAHRWCSAVYTSQQCRTKPCGKPTVFVLGEGETAWPKLVADLQRGRPEPCYDARRVSFALADAPMPRFDLLPIDRYNRLSVQTQRGCPFRCEFCAIVPGPPSDPRTGECAA